MSFMELDAHLEHATYLRGLASDYRDEDRFSTAADLDKAASIIRDLVSAAKKADEKPRVSLHDAMAVWEYFYENGAAEMENLHIRDYGINECREYVADTVTPFCDKWFDFAVDNYGYDKPYDLEFVPDFLSALPHYDIENLKLSKIRKALKKACK